MAYNGSEGVGLDDSIQQMARGNGDYPDRHRDSNAEVIDAGKLSDPYEDLRSYERGMMEFSRIPGLGLRAPIAACINRDQDEKNWVDPPVIDLISLSQTQDTNRKPWDEDEDGSEVEYLSQMGGNNTLDRKWLPSEFTNVCYTVGRVRISLSIEKGRTKEGKILALQKIRKGGDPRGMEDLAIWTVDILSIKSEDIITGDGYCGYTALDALINHGRRGLPDIWSPRCGKVVAETALLKV